MLEDKITAIGNSMGIVRPKEVLNKFKAGTGDTLYLVERPDGFTLTPYRTDFVEQMEAAELVMISIDCADVRRASTLWH